MPDTALTKQLNLDIDLLESFIRSGMRPVNSNAADSEKLNVINHANLPFESIKRLYIQDFHQTLLGGDSFLYNLVTANNADWSIGSISIPTNLVTISPSSGNLVDVARACIISKLGDKSFSIGQTSFHTSVEFTISDRNSGLYDKSKFITDNAEMSLVEMGKLEEIFKEEENLLLNDIRNEQRMVYYQTIAKRIFELFARLSNMRLSVIMYTDQQTSYPRNTAVAALDIFYNLMSRMSEAKRVHIKDELANSDSNRLQYSRASYFNANSEEMLRPSWFVRNLVDIMGRWVNYYRYQTGSNAIMDGSVTAWSKVRSMVTAKSGNNYTWFARSTGSSGTYNSVGNDGIFTHYSFPSNSGFVDSFTGIHLSKLGSTNIKADLENGLVALVEAFAECFRDPEILKIVQLDASNNVTGATSLWHVNSSPSQSENGGGVDSASGANVGELQYAIMLERIISKIYSHLNVKYSSFQQSNRPVINMDFGFRFLADECLAGKDGKWGNDIETLRDTYTNLADYISLIKGSGFLASVGITGSDLEFLNATINAISNPKEFDFQLEKWSLCPYRNEFGPPERTKQVISVTETKVGSPILNIDYTQAGHNCPYAEAFHTSGTVDDNGSHRDAVTYGCKAEWIKSQNPSATISGIPPTCPIYANLMPTGSVSSSSSQSYLHTLFKIASGKYVFNVDTSDVGFYKTEKDSQGYGGDELSEEVASNVGYIKQTHAPIQLAFMDHIIHLCQILYKINNYIAINMPYVKIKVDDTSRYYYGSENAGSFEPVTCYRFSNFHALNKKSKASPESLFAYPKGEFETFLRAVNRDLSGEGSSELQLDRQRKIDGTSTLESSRCYPYYWYSTDDIVTGLVSNSSPSSCGSAGLYRIHRYNTHDTVTSLGTFQVFVKRFRPIYLPTANELYETLETDKVNDVDVPKEIYGWNPIPHKNSADPYFNKNNIIIPMNLMSHNSPRCRWFNEMDLDFWECETNSTGTPVKGYYEVKKDEGYASKMNTPEYKNFLSYDYRDWLMVASYRTGMTILSTNAALSNTPTNEQLDNSNVGTANNTYILGTKGNLTGDITITKDNLSKFDSVTVDDVRDSRSNSINLCANWLYITIPAPKGGTHMTTAEKLFPWVFWHSSRGGTGRDPHLYTYGLGFSDDGVGGKDHSGTTNGKQYCSEIGFNSKQMRWHTVKSVLAQDNILDPEKVYKGAYDPVSCGTENRWHIHGSDRYGVTNNATEGIKNYDRYWNPLAVVGGVGFRSGTDANNDLFTNTQNEDVLRDAMDHPMTWSLWNVVRYAIWYNYNVKDIDYIEGEGVKRTTISVSTDEIEEMTFENMKILYEEWYDRFTHNGVYSSNAGISESDNWPSEVRRKYLYDKDGKKITECPKTWIQAQTLCNNTTEIKGPDKGRCYHEWTNVLASISVLYNEVSDTHDSMISFYTGANNFTCARDPDDHPNDDEFKGWVGDDTTKWKGGTGPTSTTPQNNVKKLFRYALDKVDMCRNHLAYIYGGYNSTVPEAACKDGIVDGKYKAPYYQMRSTFPKSLFLPLKITYINESGSSESKKNKSDKTVQFKATSRCLKDYYPPTEENDTEPFDCNEYNVRYIPVYPNWYSLRDATKTKPVSPSAVTREQLKQVVFCICPCSYWDQLMKGNDGEVGNPRQFGERMMAFRINHFLIGGLANKVSGGSSITEYIANMADTIITILADEPGVATKPGAKPWGQGAVDPSNRTDAYKHQPL